MPPITKKPAIPLAEAIPAKEHEAFLGAIQVEKTMVLGAFLGAFGHVAHQIDRLVGLRRLEMNLEDLYDALEDTAKPDGQRRPKSLWSKCEEITKSTPQNRIELGPNFTSRLKHFQGPMREIRNRLSHSMTEIRGDQLFIGTVGDAWNVTDEECRPNNRKPLEISLRQMVQDTLWLGAFMRDCGKLANLMHDADPAIPATLDLAQPESTQP